MKRADLDALIVLARKSGFLYLHGPDGRPECVMLPIGGWWYNHLPAVDPSGPEGEHWAHDHFPRDEDDLDSEQDRLRPGDCVRIDGKLATVVTVHLPDGIAVLEPLADRLAWSLAVGEPGKPDEDVSMWDSLIEAGWTPPTGEPS